MLVNRATIRRQLSGEPIEQVDPEMRASVLDELAAPQSTIPAGGGLPAPELRAKQGRASPMTQQARTGRTSLLGDR